MNGLFNGANVDGGTFPAQIWSDYMKSAKGGFCGEFPKPSEPFRSAPFFGKYSRTGGAGTAAGKDSDATGTQDPSTGATGGDTTGGDAFDPDLYEAPPQDAPKSGKGGDADSGGGAGAPGN